MSTPEKPPLPKDPRHQRIAYLILEGVAHGEAYGKCFPKSAKKSWNSACGRILRRADVVAYMAWIRAQSAHSSVLTLLEKREFLARVVRCKINSEPDDSDLWQEFRTTETDTSTTVIRKLPSKTDAIKLDNDLSGDDPKVNALDALATALANLR